MIKVLFFDFDGTIIDTFNLKLFDYIKILDEYGYKINKNELTSLIGEKSEVIFRKLGVKVFHLDELNSKYSKYSKNSLLNKKINPCVSLKPLNNLQKKLPLIIISNSDSKSIKTGIARLGISNIFKEIYGADKFKSKEEMLKKLIKKYKIKSSEAAFVGDRYTDIISAERAGCISIAINNKCSWSSFRVIKKERPDYIIKDFKELEELIDVINKNGKRF